MTTRQRFVQALPLGLALTTVAAVWVAGAVWSFREQSRLAERLLFAVPQLLPLVLDGLAVSLAGVAYAASLDGRAAVQARLMTAVAVLASTGSNAAGAWSRTGGDPLAVTIAAGVPVAANLAFEVLLGELRRQVHRRRGAPAPVAIPYPRVIRVVLAPWPAIREWRALVLDLTDPARPAAQPDAARGVHGVDPLHVRADLDPPKEPTKPRPRRAGGTRSRKAATPRTGVTLPQEVLDVGQLVAADLAQAGQSLTHRTLLAGFRAREQSLSSDRAAVLLRTLNTGTS